MSTGGSQCFTIFTEALLRNCSDQVAPVLSEVGLDESILYDPASEVPLAKYVALLEALSLRTDSNIGLRMGLDLDSTSFGVYGHAARSATDMEMALRCMSRFIVAHIQATRLDLSINDHVVIIDYQITDPTIFQRRQDSELALSAILNCLREISGVEFWPHRVDFEHAAPEDQQLHREIFQCPLHFNQLSNRLHFSRDILSLPLRTSDIRLYRALEPLLEQQSKVRSQTMDFLGRVSRAIAGCLCLGVVSLEQIARSQGMSGRTLQRRLGELGIEFSNLVEDVRRTLALDYIKNKEYSLTEVALLVGYSESSSLSRAFRRWTQLTPQQYRQQLQTGS